MGGGNCVWCREEGVSLRAATPGDTNEGSQGGV